MAMSSFVDYYSVGPHTMAKLSQIRLWEWHMGVVGKTTSIRVEAVVPAGTITPIKMYANVEMPFDSMIDVMDFIDHSRTVCENLEDALGKVVALGYKVEVSWVGGADQ